MNIDARHIAEFYHHPYGQSMARMLTPHLRMLSDFWPHSRAQIDRLAIGCPFAVLDREQMPPILMPSEIGAWAWASPEGVITASIDSTAWPIASDLTGSILLLHALEFVQDPQHFVHEAWRVLASSGELIVVVPNRYGVLAGSATPFGQGHAFSAGEISRYLKTAGFEIKAIKKALHSPLFALKGGDASADRFDKLGRAFWYGFGGVIVIKATKRIYAPTQKSGLSWGKKWRQFTSAGARPVGARPAGAMRGAIKSVEIIKS